ncbi:hypothetical protein Pint_25648 [Pistacia integerrima]|uniref:Uncharacterized protein n=1 Tax=Pistacia integerrima TaxID=434235 RepID=A0ACC0YJ71_9ROSI|nr:hypothetical protein Pint_25648 [Pistacia integerrima]
MRVLFYYHELLGVMETRVLDPDNNTTEAQQNTYRENKKKDRKSLFFILQRVNDDAFEKIVGAKSLKQVWDILMMSFKGVEKVKKVRLQTLGCQYEL